MLASIFLTALLLIAVVSDLVFRKIPNTLIVYGMLAGFVVTLTPYQQDPDSLESLLGAFVGLLVFLPAYLFGKMGAGDLKLLSMVGIYIGPESVLMAGVCTMLTGGILAIGWKYLLAESTRFNESAPNLSPQLSSAIQLPGSSRFSFSAYITRIFQDTRYPYAPAIASGTYLGSFLTFS